MNTLDSASAPRRYKYFDLLMAAFVTVLLCSNLIAADKVVSLWGFEFGGGILFFPLSYLFNDILTEVYGYKRSRKVIWAGFASMAFAAVMATVVVKLPPSPNWHFQDAYETIFLVTPRIAIASLIAFWAGEFVNSVVMARLKVVTEGKHLWMRAVGSTIAGEAVDSLIFYPIAFLGVWETSLVIKVMIANYILKVMWEVVAIPLTYRIVAFLKRAENEDYYDVKTNFTPFSLEM